MNVFFSNDWNSEQQAGQNIFTWNNLKSPAHHGGDSEGWCLCRQGSYLFSILSIKHTGQVIFAIQYLTNAQAHCHRRLDQPATTNTEGLQNMKRLGIAKLSARNISASMDKEFLLEPVGDPRLPNLVPIL